MAQVSGKWTKGALVPIYRDMGTHFDLKWVTKYRPAPHSLYQEKVKATFLEVHIESGILAKFPIQKKSPMLCLNRGTAES